VEADNSKPGALKVAFSAFLLGYLVFGLDEENTAGPLSGTIHGSSVVFVEDSDNFGGADGEDARHRRGQGFDVSKLYLVPQKAR
jgi:lipocalin